jgi:hypothetical protein
VKSFGPTRSAVELRHTTLVPSGTSPRST